MKSQDNSNITQFPSDAWELLGHARFTAARLEKMEAAARRRTKHIRLIVQDIHSPHNVSACMRSAEAFGILNVDIVNLKEKFKPSTVSRGVEKWLRVRKFNAISVCAANLKSQGYRIVAGLPSQTSKSLYELDVERPLAVVFGNEHVGISPEWQPYVDEYFTIPMVGLVESLNISVSAALALHELAKKAIALPALAQTYHLNSNEVAELLNEWTCRQVSSWEGEIESLRKKQD